MIEEEICDGSILRHARRLHPSTESSEFEESEVDENEEEHRRSLSNNEIEVNELSTTGSRLQIDLFPMLNFK